MSSSKIIWKKNVVRTDGVEKEEIISWLSPPNVIQLYNNINIAGNDLYSHRPINTFTKYRERFGRNLIARCVETPTGRWKLTLESKNERLLANELTAFYADKAQEEAEIIIDRYLQDFMINGNL